MSLAGIVLDIARAQRDQVRNDICYQELPVVLIGAGVSGIYHLVGAGACSRFEFATELLGLMRSDARVVPTTTAAFPSKAHRPRYAVLADAEAAPAQTNEKEAVNLSSVHQAKGLEFHTIFVIWLADGMFPSSRSLDTRDALEEERRLFYVAITRARDELYLTYPHMRLSGGYGEVFQRPSRFLQEIPNDLVEDWQVTKK